MNDDKYPEGPESANCVNAVAFAVVSPKYPLSESTVGVLPPPPTLVIPEYDEPEILIVPELGADTVTVPVSLAKSEKSKLIPEPVGCEAVILI
jgi:hypothetical protein